MDKVRVLLVGTGFAAALHMEGYLRSGKDVEIAGVCDIQPDQADALIHKYRLSNAQKYADYHEAIDRTNCDLVDVCVPNFLHYQVCMAALAKGRNVICEKPLATTVAHAREMVEKAAEMNRHLYYAEDWLFTPAIMRALEIVEEGALGRVCYMRARECHSGSHSPFAQSIATCGGGAMIHLGIHPLGFMLAIKGHDWVELTAMGSSGMERNYVHKSCEGEDLAACFLTFGDGSSALVEANYVTTGGMEDCVDFYGDKGCLHLNLNQEGPISCYSIPGLSYAVEKAEITAGWSHPAYDEIYTLGYIGEIRHFLDCCARKEDARIGLRGADGLAALEALECIYQSMREGRRISNPKRVSLNA